jgi:hypothetical protein
VASPPYGGLRTGEVSATIGGTPHILYIYLYTYASMTGLARSPAPTARAVRASTAGLSPLSTPDSTLMGYRQWEDRFFRLIFSRKTASCCVA